MWYDDDASVHEDDRDVEEYPFAGYNVTYHLPGNALKERMENDSEDDWAY